MTLGIGNVGFEPRRTEIRRKVNEAGSRERRIRDVIIDHV